MASSQPHGSQSLQSACPALLLSHRLSFPKTHRHSFTMHLGLRKKLLGLQQALKLKPQQQGDQELHEKSLQPHSEQRASFANRQEAIRSSSILQQLRSAARHTICAICGTPILTTYTQLPLTKCCRTTLSACQTQTQRCTRPVRRTAALGPSMSCLQLPAATVFPAGRKHMRPRK